MTPFTVVDQTSQRQDLARRKEVKYAIVGADAGKLRSHLSINCRRQVHNGPVSTVRSIYFDDARLSACQANLDGVGIRNKLRLRWYDTLRPRRDAFLEIKWRDNRVTGKHRMQLQSVDPLHQLSYAQIMDGLHETVPEQYQHFLLRYNEPVAIVEYKREHFVSDDGSLRVTLDYDLTFYDQLGRQSISTDFACRMDDLVVLEGKLPVGRETDLRRLLQPFAARANRCSKYVHGCRLLGHIFGGE